MPSAWSTWRSPDAYFHLISVVISALVLSEVFVAGSRAAKVVSCIALALQGLGYNAGRARARAAASGASSVAGEGGFVKLDLACLVLFLGLVLFGAATTACQAFTGRDAARAGAATVVDCASKQALAATHQYGPTVEQLLAGATTNEGKLDRPTLEQATKGFLAETGWCVVENVVAAALARLPLPGAPQASPLALNAEDAKDALGAIRAARYAGQAFKPAVGGQ